MIVEDSAIVRRRLAEMVCDLDLVKVLAMASDGEEALRLFRVQQPDVVLLDLHLPGRSGLETLRQMRIENQSNVVIVLTSETQPEFRAASLKAGADFFLSKSDDHGRIPEILRDLTCGRTGRVIRPENGVISSERT